MSKGVFRLVSPFRVDPRFHVISLDRSDSPCRACSKSRLTYHWKSCSLPPSCLVDALGLGPRTKPSASGRLVFEEPFPRCAEGKARGSGSAWARPFSVRRRKVIRSGEEGCPTSRAATENLPIRCGRAGVFRPPGSVFRLGGFAFRSAKTKPRKRGAPTVAAGIAEELIPSDVRGDGRASAPKNSAKSTLT